MDESAFLSAMLDNPEDLVLRLVYSDWLEDRGELDRAELIRVQCELARLSQNAPQVSALRRRERDILDERQMEWARPLLDLGAVRWSFERGLLTWAMFTAEDFLCHAAELLRLTHVRHVRLLEARGKLETLAECPHLAQLHHLEIPNDDWEDEENALRDADLAALAASPYLHGLSSLNLAGHRSGDAGLLALAGASSLERLTCLDLSGQRLSETALTALTHSTFFVGLRKLRLAHAVDDGGVLVLAGTPALNCLTSLDLTNYRSIGVTGVQALAQSPHLTALTSLCLRHTTSGVEEPLALANSPLLGRLRQLDLGHISAEGVRAILSSSYLRSNTTLRVTHCTMGAEAPLAPDELRLTWGVKGDLGAILAKAKLPPALTTLSLQGAFKEPKALSGWSQLSNLVHLEIDSDFTKEMAQALANVPLSSLRHLRLYANSLGKQEVQALLDSPQLAKLETLTLDLRVQHWANRLVLSSEELQRLAHSPRVRLNATVLSALVAREDWPLPWRNLLFGTRVDRLLTRFNTTDLGDTDLEQLACLPLLARLVEMDLFGIRHGPAGARALAASPHVTNLRSLRHSFSPIGDDGAEALAASPYLANLRTLKLSFCKIGDRGVCAFASSPYLTRLTTLKLWDCSVTDVGARAIAASPTLANLVKLRLRGNSIGDAGAVALAESPHLQQMLDLSLSHNPIGTKGWDALRRRFGKRLGLAIGEWDQLD